VLQTVRSRVRLWVESSCFLRGLNSSGRTMVLGSTVYPEEMSTRITSFLGGGVKVAGV